MLVGRANLTEAEWIEIENNRYRTWYDGAGIILFNKQNQILLVQDAFSKRWSFPKGRVEIDDNPINTAIRETKEEVGLEYITDYILNSFDPVMIHYDSHFFKAALINETSTPITDGSNECAYRWCSKSLIKNKLWNYTNTYIKTFITLYW